MSTTSNKDLYDPNVQCREQSGVPSMTPADAKRKQFFLEEAKMLCPAANNCSEYSKMYALSKKLRRMVKLFTLLYEHKWGEIYPDVQRAFGLYVIEGYASKKERIRYIEQLAKEVGFITQIAQYNDFMGILKQHYEQQLSDIEFMLKLYYPPEGSDPFATK